MDRPEIILAPGPTPIPPEVLLAQGSPLVYHRGPGFGDLMRDVTGRLKTLYRTDSADVLLMTASGTGGLESAVQNVLLAGRRGLRAAGGLLRRAVPATRRVAGAGRAHDRTSRGVSRVDPAKVADALAEHPVKAVLLTQSETSTGVIQPIEELARVANDAGALVVVDVVSSLGAVPFAFDEWGDRRRGRRLAEGAQREPGPRVRRRQRARVGGVAERDVSSVLLRLGDLPALRRPAAPGEPVDPRHQRDAGAAAPHSICTSRTVSRRRWRGTGRSRRP